MKKWHIPLSKKWKLKKNGEKVTKISWKSLTEMTHTTVVIAPWQTQLPAMLPGIVTRKKNNSSWQFYHAELLSRRRSCWNTDFHAKACKKARPKIEFSEKEQQCTEMYKTERQRVFVIFLNDNSEFHNFRIILKAVPLMNWMYNGTLSKAHSIAWNIQYYFTIGWPEDLPKRSIFNELARLAGLLYS